MLSAFRNAFKIPELRGKILFTVAIIAVYRLGSHLPVPGVDFVAVQNYLRNPAAQDPNGGHLVGGQHVAADSGQPAGGLVSGQAGLGAPQLPEHRAHRLTGSSRKVERRPLRPRRRHPWGGLGHGWLLVTRRRDRSSDLWQ